LLVGNETLSDEKLITENLFSYYEEQSKPATMDLNDPHDQQVELEYQEIMRHLQRPADVELEGTTTFEVTRIIKNMKGKKSSGHDQISNQIIKLLTPRYIECLVSCFNKWLRENKYPDLSKEAKIITLNKLKAGVPKCTQTRPISLLATHSKLFEKILLDRVRQWAEGSQLIPREQSGFRATCLLPTGVLSIYQEVRNNLAANAPTLAIYVDYEKAFDRVWHKGLLVKLYRMNMPVALLKMIESWLKGRTASICYGKTKSNIFQSLIGLPQGSSLSPYIFIVFHSDLVTHLGAHSAHLFADDLNVLIRAPLQKLYTALVKFLEIEGTRICERIASYSHSWKQPINVAKTVAQVFYSQVTKPVVKISMLGENIKVVDTFKYLGFTWSSKLSLKPTIDICLQNIQSSLCKLKWLRSGKVLAKDVLRKCFFAYTFPHFVWIFPFYPFLPPTQREALNRKFRVAIRLVHRATYVSAKDLFQYTGEVPLGTYVQRYISKRLKNIYRSDLGHSLFLEDIFFWDKYHKRKDDELGHFFRMKRVKNLQKKHRSLLLDWLAFI
jgi:hypothetical protein